MSWPESIIYEISQALSIPQILSNLENFSPTLLTSLVDQSNRVGDHEMWTTLLHIITSTGDELFRFVNINDLESSKERF